VEDRLKIPKHTYIARMIERGSELAIERLFDDPEAAIRYAKDRGLEIKSVRKYTDKK
jgi:hypothetical protein